MSVVVTGWNGQLGRALLPLLISTHQSVTLAGRTPPKFFQPGTSWVKFDLLDQQASVDLQGEDTVIHLASRVPDFSFEADVSGTRHLLEQCKRMGVRHFIYMSIVGIDRVPLKYYRIKLATEDVVKNAGVPYTILRATQFHQFFSWQVAKLLHMAVPIAPKSALFQPIDIEVVAKKLAELATSKGMNETIELGGPDVISLGQALDQWQALKGRKKFVINLPAFFLGRIGVGLLKGALTTPQTDRQGVSWQRWIEKHHQYFDKLDETPPSADR